VTSSAIFRPQFGIELHTGRTSLGVSDLAGKFSSLLDTIRKLYALGFRLVSTANNDCVGKSDDPGRKVRIRVARYFLMQHTKTGKIYQMAVK
jgi:hypothetical protein